MNDSHHSGPREDGRAACAPEGPAPAVSVIVPTFREAPNIGPLLASIGAVRLGAGLDLDVWIMDDQSRDGSREMIEALSLPWVTLIERSGPRGLSAAVIEGIHASSGESVVVMDADLSHPASAIPAMLDALAGGADFVVGSRNTPGASTDAGWGLPRRLNTLVATTLARPLARLRDPMSGFIAFRRRLLEDAAALNPVGYKIGLELIVKSRARRIVEVPIHFADRQAGRSKLNLRQQLLYLEHLRRLYAFKLANRQRAPIRVRL